jgi:hypothetical protein
MFLARRPIISGFWSSYECIFIDPTTDKNAHKYLMEGGCVAFMQ